MAALMRCPVCDGASFRLSASENKLRREIRLREHFVQSRLRHAPNPAETKDLLDFMHGSPAPLYACNGCGLVMRGADGANAAASYEDDPNDRDVMRSLLPRYVEAFRRKEAYRPMLLSGARVLEVGSHLGGFLQVAGEWNWNAEGLDVGQDTADFARDSGFRVQRAVLEDAVFPSEPFDAVFVWNCFEQLENPRGALRVIRRLLKRFGLLVVRVPNLWFYRTVRDPRALAYNNLLGFPYLHGYTAETLHRLVSREGFEFIRGFNSELVALPFADPNERVLSEERAVSRAVEQWSARKAARQVALSGPWIEMVYRKVEEPQPALEVPVSPVDPRFLRRAA
jgi:SAM-dependent methyltransferase